MIDVTETVLAFRECARGVWNGTMRAKAEPYVDFDAIDAFGVIRAVLFEQLVLRPLGMGNFKRLGVDEPFPFLRLRPAANPLALMVNRPSQNGNLYWDDPIRSLPTGGLVLAFVDFHDWDQFGYIDLQHFKVRIEASREHPELVGRAALVDTHHAGVVFESPSPRTARALRGSGGRRRAK